jgi:hypothetical protein
MSPVYRLARHLGRALLRGLRWAFGCELEYQPPTEPPLDTLEPYCSEETLQLRLSLAPPLPTPEHKAIHKIGARYGAEL